MNNNIGPLFEKTLPETEPATRYTVDETVRAGRWRRRRNRLAATGGGVLAATVAAALAIALVPGAASDTNTGKGDAAASQTAEKTPDVPKVDPRKDIAKDIEMVLLAQQEGMEATPNGDSGEFELKKEKKVVDGKKVGGYRLGAVLTDSRGNNGGLFQIGVYGPGTFTTDPLTDKVGKSLMYCAKAPCEETKSPDGDPVFTQSGIPIEPDDGIGVAAVVYHAAGTAIVADVTCGGGGGRPSCQSPLLIAQDLESIITQIPDVTPLFED